MSVGDEEGDGRGGLKSRAKEHGLLGSRDGGGGGGELACGGDQGGEMVFGEAVDDDGVGEGEAEMVAGFSGRSGIGTCARNTLE